MATSIGIGNGIPFLKRNNIKLPIPIAMYSASGRSNTEPLEQRQVLPDLTGNGNDINLYGFKWNDTSGFNKFYKIDFLKTVINGVKVDTDKTTSRHGVFYNDINSEVHYFYFKGNFQGETKINIVKCTFWKAHFEYLGLDYKYHKLEDITHNGIYTLNIDEPTIQLEIKVDSGGLLEAGIALEEIYNNKIGLYFDGIDNYGRNDHFPVFTNKDGFTIIAEKNVTFEDMDEWCSLATDAADSKVEYGGYAFDSISPFTGQPEVVSFGGETEGIPVCNEVISYMTSTNYNGTPITKGNNLQSKPNILIGRYRMTWDNYFWKGILLSLHIFDHDLTEQEIKNYIKYKIK